MCAYTLVLTTDKQEKLPEHKYFDLILESIILGDELNWSSKTYRRDEFFEKAKNIGSVVREVTLKAVCTPQQGIKTSEVSWLETLRINWVTISNVHAIGIHGIQKRPII
jgi:hypothetical protein